MLVMALGNKAGQKDPLGLRVKIGCSPVRSIVLVCILAAMNLFFLCGSFNKHYE